MKKTKGGFLITQIKQIQGRVFDSLLQKAGIEELMGLRAESCMLCGRRITYPL